MTESEKHMGINSDNMPDSVPLSATEKAQSKVRPPQHVIDKMNRVIIAAAKVGKTPAELEDDLYREMFE